MLTYIKSRIVVRSVWMCRFMWNERNSRKLLWKQDRSPLLKPSCGHDVILKCLLLLLSLSETWDLSAVFPWALRWVQFSELCRKLTKKQLQVERPLRRDTWSQRERTKVSACNGGAVIKGRVCKIYQVLFTHKWSESEIPANRDKVTVGLIIRFSYVLSL